VVSQGFGPSDLSLEPPITYKGVFYPHFHTGLDIAAPLGAPVGAAADGVVLLATSSVDSAGNLVGYGNYVLIQHRSGLLSVYGHLSKLLVHAGQAVRQGQVIGLCGSTGWSTGPHVHFEIRLNGTPVDPAPYIQSELRRY
jgi:murein DD-endopeptidase MepM/ murein hydrolase activator NlpD